MHKELPPGDRRRISRLKIASYAGLTIGAFVLVCGLALLIFHDPLVNRFIKPRVEAAFVEAYPAYSIHIGDMNYSLLKDSFGFDSVALSAADNSLTSIIATLSVSGIGWMHLLWGGSLAPHDFDNAFVDAHGILLTFPRSQYELRCTRLRLSVADSAVIANALELHPGVDDEDFFTGSTFRRTRFRFTAQHCWFTGVAFLEAMDHQNYRARSIHLSGIGLDILINKDKPAARDSSTLPMPGEILSSMKETMRCDTLGITDGSLKYGERFVAGSKPAVITIDSLGVLALGFANHADRNAPLVIHAKGQFMKAGTMTLRMSIPVQSPEFSFNYSGALGGMELSTLNSFLETAERKRIKSGFLHAATFEINVASGQASGNVRALYKDLTLAAINKKTGSEKGFVDGITSYIANTYKLRGTNMPGKSGLVLLGRVRYLRQRGDPFFGFVWFALRSGVADVVGF